jgi:hypothetical protein
MKRQALGPDQDSVHENLAASARPRHKMGHVVKRQCRLINNKVNVVTMENNVSTEFLRQRRAVHHGLCSVLSEDEAITVLNQWVSHIGNSGSVFNGLNVFVRNVCTQLGKSELQREMLQSINRALMAKEEELRAAPDISGVKPVAEKAKVRSAAPKEVAIEVSDSGIDTAEFESFQSLWNALLEQVANQSDTMALDLRVFVQQVVENLPWSEAQHEQMLRFVETGRTAQTRAYRPGQLKTLMGHIRIWLTDNLGETASGRTVDMAISHAEQSATNKRYACKQFF